MTTSTLFNQEIESIEIIGDNVMFITTEDIAKRLLKRNPRASITKGNKENDRYAVIYSINECNLLMAVRKV